MRATAVAFSAAALIGNAVPHVAAKTMPWQSPQETDNIADSMPVASLDVVLPETESLSTDLASLTQCDAGACDGLDETTCAGALDAIVMAMPDASRLNLQMQFMGADKICENTNPADCLATLDEYRSELSESSRAKLLTQACADAEDSQLSLQCDSTTCEGLSDEQCVASLDIIIATMDDASRLNIQMQFMGADKLCDSKNPLDCLSLLDEYRNELSDSSRMKMVSEACAAAPEVLDLQCDDTTCADLDDAACAQNLDIIVATMSDETRLGLEKNFMGADKICAEKEDSECLSTLDEYRMELPESTRMQMVSDACAAMAMDQQTVEEAAPSGAAANGAANAVPPQEAPTNADCDASTCEGLVTEECMVKLDGIVATMADDSRLDLQMHFMGADQICSDLEEGECLGKLDQYRSELGDSTRLQMLMSACTEAAGDNTPAAETEEKAGVEDAADEETQGSDAQGQGYLQAVATCDATMCDELADAKCIATLDATVKAMSDKTRLSYELHFDGAASICSLLTDKECLDLLDTYRLELTDSSRMKVLLGACATQAASANEAAETSSSKKSANTQSSSSASSSDASEEEPSVLDADAEATSTMTGTKNSKTTEGGEATGHEAFLDPDETYTEEEEANEEAIEEGTATTAGGHGVADALTDQENAEVGQRNQNTNRGGGLLVGQTVDGLGGDVASAEDATEDEITCPMCDDLTDKDCLSTLDTMVDGMSDDDRFAFEKSFATYHGTCAALDDFVCLEALDSARTSASDKDRLTMLKDACIFTSGSAESTDAAKAAAPASDVPSPDSDLPAPQDSDANPAPDEADHTDHTDHTDRADHAGVPKDDTDDEKAEDGEAQEEAHERHPEVGGSDGDDESSGIAKGGSSSGSTGTSMVAPKPDVTVDTCEVCASMTDKQCLAALDDMVTEMDDIDRLAFEKSWAAGVCDGKSDAECLEQLDQVRMSATDKNRLTMLYEACASSPAGSEAGSGTTPDEAVGAPDLDVPADQDGSEHEEGSIIEEPLKDKAGESSAETTADTQDGVSGMLSGSGAGTEAGQVAPDGSVVGNPEQTGDADTSADTTESSSTEAEAPDGSAPLSGSGAGTEAGQVAPDGSVVGNPEQTGDADTSADTTESSGTEAEAPDGSAPLDSMAPLETVNNNSGDEAEVPAIATIASTEEDNDSREWNLMMAELSKAQAAKATPTSTMSATSVGVTASALLVLGVAFAVVNRRLRRPVGDSAYANIDVEDDEVETEALLPDV